MFYGMYYSAETPHFVKPSCGPFHKRFSIAIQIRWKTRFAVIPSMVIATISHMPWQYSFRVMCKTVWWSRCLNRSESKSFRLVRIAMEKALIYGILVVRNWDKQEFTVRKQNMSSDLVTRSGINGTYQEICIRIAICDVFMWFGTG